MSNDLIQRQLRAARLVAGRTQQSENDELMRRLAAGPTTEDGDA